MGAVDSRHLPRAAAEPCLAELVARPPVCSSSSNVCVMAMGIQLDADQSRAVSTVLTGVNVAVVRPGGCGKSETLKLVVRKGKEKSEEKGVVVLAWSGSAANLVGGQALASLLRVTVGDPSKESILKRLMEPCHRVVWHTILTVRLVVIDEAPTIEGRWFDRLEYVFRMATTVFNQCRPFGDQVVFAAGDPLQLAAHGVTDVSVEVSAYRTRAWADTFSSSHGETVRLTGQHWQGDGDGLRNILDPLRFGNTTDADITALNASWGDQAYEQWFDFTHMRARNVDATNHNEKMMARLLSERFTFKCHCHLVPLHSLVHDCCLLTLLQPPAAAHPQRYALHRASCRLSLRHRLPRSHGRSRLSPEAGSCASCPPGIWRRAITAR
eukprot:TRINITY_DN6788_c0_g1_i1.p1 TRINITY_DN6788_c0_g1~~TRINITY_DN6788_c0_g1_i1.p1  ORF type:complete len:382 (-),score=26.45 TRINITY_DN6788_c0_g1_i1:1274-2419(-)